LSGENGNWENGASVSLNLGESSRERDDGLLKRRGAERKKLLKIAGKNTKEVEIPRWQRFC